MSKTIEQLAKEHGHIINNGKRIFFGSMDKLEAFAKAYAQTQGQSIPDRKILSEIAYEAHKRSIGNDCEPRFSINISGIEYLISEVMPAAPIESGVKG
jgi:hypothetical protein